MVQLAMDTATAALSVAVGEEKRILGEAALQLGKHHSAHILPQVEQLLAACDRGPEDLEAVVVGVGPGSYTGVRVGVTVAKTLAWTCGIPVVPVSTLVGLAGHGRDFQGVVVPMLDARRQRVYAGVFAGGSPPRRETPDRLWTVQELVEYLAGDGRPVLALGDGAVRYREMLLERLGDRVMVADVDRCGVRATHLLEWYWAGGEEETADPVWEHEEGASLSSCPAVLVGEAVHGLVPRYLQLAEAEAKWREQGR